MNFLPFDLKTQVLEVNKMKPLTRLYVNEITYASKILSLHILKVHILENLQRFTPVLGDAIHQSGVKVGVSTQHCCRILGFQETWETKENCC
jgi:hypothetical protein